MENDVIDLAWMLNLDLQDDPIFLYSNKRIDYIFMTPNLAAKTVKLGTISLISTL